MQSRAQHRSHHYSYQHNRHYYRNFSYSSVASLAFLQATQQLSTEKDYRLANRNTHGMKLGPAAGLSQCRHRAYPPPKNTGATAPSVLSRVTMITAVMASKNIIVIICTTQRNHYYGHPKAIRISYTHRCFRLLFVFTVLSGLTAVVATAASSAWCLSAVTNTYLHIRVRRQKNGSSERDESCTCSHRRCYHCGERGRSDGSGHSSVDLPAPGKHYAYD